MRLLKQFISKLSPHSLILFSAGDHSPFLQAARKIIQSHIGVPIFIGNRSEIKSALTKLDLSPEQIQIFDPSREENRELLWNYIKTQPHLDFLEEEVFLASLEDYNVIGALLLAMGKGDILLLKDDQTRESLPTLKKILNPPKSLQKISSLLVLDREYNALGANGLLFMGDCGTLEQPTREDLVNIAFQSAKWIKLLSNDPPRIAFLSYSTHAEFTNDPSVLKMRQAAVLTKIEALAKNIELEAEGEMQVDVALSSSIAALKGTDNAVAGKANCLIFPDLNSGHITSRVIQIATGTRCYGPLLLGFPYSVANIGVESSVREIFGTVVLLLLERSQTG